MASLFFKNISKVYEDNEIKVIEDFNLEIKNEEFIVLIGPSGCGKSTLLRMICGLEDITSGDIYIDENLINNVEPKDRDIAMVFQNYALYPHMTVYKNMAFTLNIKKVDKKEIDIEVRKTAKALSIEDLLHRKPRELSGGQRQRVALGRAIVRNPKVFLMDEPLSNLDAKLRMQTRIEITKLHKQLKTTFIYVTHDQTEAMTMADRIVIMDNGKIQQVGTPQEVYNNPSNIFVASFIGSPQMNLVNGTIIEKDNQLIFKSDSFEVVISKAKSKILKEKGCIDSNVTFGIRPENISIQNNNDEKRGIRCKVDVVELLGYEAYLHLFIGKCKLIARIEIKDGYLENEEIKVSLNDERFHFFDSISGKTII